MAHITLGRRQFTLAATAGAASWAMPALAQGEPIKVGVIVPALRPGRPQRPGRVARRPGDRQIG